MKQYSCNVISITFTHKIIDPPSYAERYLKTVLVPEPEEGYVIKNISDIMVVRSGGETTFSRTYEMEKI